MATTAQLRNAIRNLSRRANDDIQIALRRIDNPELTRRQLDELLPALIQAYGAAAATVAAEWYDERRAEKRIRGRFRAQPSGLRNGGGGEALAGYSTAVLLREDPDVSRFRTLLAGGIQLRLANAARDTIMDASIGDSQSRGWQREADGGCEFCQMLASRGAVYSDATVDFGAHDNCNCVAVPAFEGEPRPVKPYTPSERRLNPDGTLRPISDIDRERVNAWIRDNLRT